MNEPYPGLDRRLKPRVSMLAGWRSGLTPLATGSLTDCPEQYGRAKRDTSEHWLALPDSLCSAAPHTDECRGELRLYSCPDIDLRFVGRHIAFVFCNLTFS